MGLGKLFKKATKAVGKVVDPLDIVGLRAKDKQKRALKQSRLEQEDAARKQGELLAPYAQAGEGALALYRQLVGLDSGVDVGETVRKTPGFQFAVEEEERALRRQASAGGFRGSGRLFDALMERASKRAMGTYQQTLGNLTPLMAGGQNAVVGQGAAIQAGSDARVAELIGKVNASQGVRNNVLSLVGTGLGFVAGGGLGAQVGNQVGAMAGSAPMQAPTNPYTLTGSALDLSFRR